MDGVLVIDKPEGITSFDVVARVRRRLHIRRVGHTGTLDPMATGVLPLCLGEATRLVPFLTEGDKVYEARVRLGAATDTLDRTGRVVAESDWRHVGRGELEAALARFRGPILQTPPMHSAIRVDGRRLYELAREGVEVERASRGVTIHALDLVAFDPPEFAMRVHCSKGTYIRTLADDLGRALGTHAHLTALRRTASGGFGIEKALALDALERLEEGDAAEAIAARLIRGAQVLGFLPQVALDEQPALARRVGMGQRLTARDLPQLAAHARGARLRVTSGDELLAVAEWTGEVLQYLRVLQTAPASPSKEPNRGAEEPPDSDPQAGVE